MSNRTKPKPIPRSPRAPRTPGTIPRRKEGETELLIWGVPDNLKKRFKIACLRKDTTMRDVIIAAIEQYVTKYA